MTYRASGWGLAALLAASTLMPAAAEEPHDFQRPSVVIEKPTEGSLNIPLPQANPASPLEQILIEGAAGDNVEVFAVTLRIYDTLGRSFLAYASCEGCGSKVARWSYRAFLAPGSYVIEAMGHDPSGNTGTSPRRSFLVI